MACTVTSTDAGHGFQLVTTYITDPASDTVLMQTKLQNAPGSAANLKHLAPVRAARRPRQRQRRGRPPERRRELRGARHQHRLAGPGDFSTNTVTNAANRDYAVPTYMALAASTPQTTASVGYAGAASDGLVQLDLDHALTSYGTAPDGHVVATEDVTPGPST